MELKKRFLGILQHMNMQPLFDLNTLPSIKGRDKVPFKCEACNQTFYVMAKSVRYHISHGITYENRYCSRQCIYDAHVTAIETCCTQCGKAITCVPSQKKKSKSGNMFCSRSCAAKYNNAHKTKGTRRSKLEVWLELQLTTMFPSLTIKYNDVETINAELDIYVPSLNIAFELNGIFHYEPIYGPEKLASIKTNDDRRFQACLEKNIELVIIDTSGQKYFKESSSKKYLDIIAQLINQKLGARNRTSTCNPLGNGF